MAYRASERRERAQDSYAPSYLDDFLDLIEPLQASTKTTFADIKTLDDRIQTSLSLADSAADDTVARANSSVAIASVRRQYQEFLNQQLNVQELSDKKVALAAAALGGLDDVLTQLDSKLRDFEAQLKREGRWPGAVPPKQSLDTSAPVKPAAEVPATRNAQKATRRDAPPLPPTPPPPPPPPPPQPAPPQPASKAPVSATAPPARGKPSVSVEQPRRDVVMTDSSGSDKVKKEAQPVADMVTDTAVDNTIYCICRQVSSGKMVACEDDDCPYEWFHFECVGLTQEPAGVWYCPECSEKRKKGTRRKH